MSLRTWLLNTLIPEIKAAASAPPPVWLAETIQPEDAWSGYDESSHGQKLLFQKLSWIHTAVTKVAQVGAGTDFNVLKRKGEKLEDIQNHPFELLLQEPNPLMSRFEFLEATLIYYTLTGNAYWYLNGAVGKAPAELWLIPSEMVSPIPDGMSYLRGYKFDAGHGQLHILAPEEVVHFKRFNPHSLFVGASPLDSLMDIAIGDLAMQRWNRNLFARDNAKVPGALAFADPIPDTEWDSLKRDINRQHGGVRRSLMMLRNVGKGGVQWINMALGQKEMEFLEGRQANKEEIFNVFAPGLSSILDVNATEANATVARRTFYELAVWPILRMMGEKVTQRVLPLYGPDLVGEFEDIRPTDRAMRLNEQQAAAQVMTVDELRAEFYDLDPIGDDRGLLLPAQISPTLTIPIEEPEPEPVPVPMLPGPVEPEGAQPTEDTPDVEEELTPSDTGVPAAKALEARAFRRWLKRHPGRDPLTFKAEHLTEAERTAILEEEAATAAAPFRFYP